MIISMIRMNVKIRHLSEVDSLAEIYLITISKIIRMIIRIIRLQIAVRAEKLIQRSKIPPYVVVLHRGVLTTYGGRKSKFGFATVFGAKNEVGIDENISVGYT